jgi:hypothetical protein
MTLPLATTPPGDPSGRLARFELANALAAQIDSAQRVPPLDKPLVNWHEGDAIAHLLDALARVIADEPLGELATELAERLRHRLGPIPGHDPKRMLAAILDNLERRSCNDG